MTVSFHDHDRRLYDLELALCCLMRSMAEAGQLPIVREAARKARADGARGAAELLDGRRAAAGYRRTVQPAVS
jgi:hypothetical protein